MNVIVCAPVLCPLEVERQRGVTGTGHAWAPGRQAGLGASCLDICGWGLGRGTAMHLWSAGGQAWGSCPPSPARGFSFFTESVVSAETQVLVVHRGRWRGCPPVSPPLCWLVLQSLRCSPAVSPATASSRGRAQRAPCSPSSRGLACLPSTCSPSGRGDRKGRDALMSHS